MGEGLFTGKLHLFISLPIPYLCGPQKEKGGEEEFAKHKQTTLEEDHMASQAQGSWNNKHLGLCGTL